MRILVTGGAGLIGSQTTLASHCAGHVVVDNLSKSKPWAHSRVEALAGRAVAELVVLGNGDSTRGGNSGGDPE